MKILVLGGTRFFGKKLVDVCIENGHDVTILTRGVSDNPFGNQVQQLKIDRIDEQALRDGLANTSWDIVYDNICYSPNEAKSILNVLQGKTKKLVFTSTLATYAADGKPKSEDDFNPYTYDIRMGESSDFTYGEGKKQAEAVFFKESKFPVVAVRFPIVVGENDYTQRLYFHVEKVIKQEPISFLNVDAKMSFITDDEAARFLYWAGISDIEGPFNATATGVISLNSLMNLIEDTTGKRSKIAIVGTTTESLSPYAIPDDWYMSTAKAESAGFKFSHLHDWLPTLIQNLVKQIA